MQHFIPGGHRPGYRIRSELAPRNASTALKGPQKKHEVRHTPRHDLTTACVPQRETGTFVGEGVHDVDSDRAPQWVLAWRGRAGASR